MQTLLQSVYPSSTIMNILIIEDEKQAAWSLSESIMRLKPGARILGVVPSVNEILDWFADNPDPDLIFSDIQLGDGCAFDAYAKLEIQCPIIFCTAYDEYLLQAFQTNGIDYLLKPVDDRDLLRSFQKLEMLQQRASAKPDMAALEVAIRQMVETKAGYKTNFLFPHRDRLIPVATEMIAYFKVLESDGDVVLIDGQSYHHNFTLDYLASVLDPAQFYRANRQYLVAHRVISNIEHIEDRKLLLHLAGRYNDKIVMSKAKAS
ncbi:MAG: response regulator transcription factor, partial [Chitinophagaceae bacterium]